MSGPGDPLLLLSILVFIGAAILVLLYEALLMKADFFEPIVLFVTFYSLYVLPLPVRAYITDSVEGNVTPYLNELYPYLPQAVLLSALGLVILVIVYRSVLVHALCATIPLPPKGNPRGSRWAFWFLLSLSLLLIVLLSISVGGFGALLLRGYGASAELVGRGYLAIGFPWGFVASLFLLYRHALRRRTRDIVWFAVVLALMVFVQMAMGKRSSVLVMLLATLIFVHYSIRRFRVREILFLGLLAFMGLNLYGFLRSSDYKSLGHLISKTSGQLVYLAESGKLGQSAFYTLTVGEFVVPFETFPQMIRSVGTEVEPLLGISFLRAPLYYIPKAVFPERPLPLANWYMKTFYGDEFGLNEGRAFFFLSEGYLNFGIAGVFLVMSLWGVFLGVLREYKARAQGEPGALLLYAVTLAFIFQAIRGEFSSLVVGLPAGYLVPALIGVLLSTGFRPWHLARARKLRSFKGKGLS